MGTAKWTWGVKVLSAAAVVLTGLSGCGKSASHDDGLSERHQVKQIVNVGADGQLDVLCSVFPIYLFTSAVAKDVPGVRVDLMLPAAMGCPHNYDLTPADVKKLAAAELFVLNGAGLEEFTMRQIDAANSEIKVVDASKGLRGLPIGDHKHHEDDHDHDHDHGEGTTRPASAVQDDHDHDHAEHHHDHDDADHDHDHGDHHDGHDHAHSHPSGINPHFFSSPAHAAMQVRAIADALSIAAPDRSEIFHKNADELTKRLEKLQAGYKQLSDKLPNKRFITVHEVFDYLAKDNGWEIEGIIFTTPGQEPSAKETRELIAKVQEAKPAAILTEPQYSAKAAKSIAEEGKVPVLEIDPIASGPDEATIDYYFTQHEKNIATLQSALVPATASK